MWNLTPEQADRLREAMRPHQQWLHDVLRRMDQRGMDPTCELYLAAHRAWEGIHHFGVLLHYASCTHGVAKKGENS